MAVYQFRKDELESQLNRNAIWAIVYGDMMSYLMILFLMMFVHTLANSRGERMSPIKEQLMKIKVVFGGEITPEEAENIKDRDLESLMLRQLVEKEKAGELGEDVSLIVTQEKIEVSMKSQILFDSGKSELKPEARAILEPALSGMRDLKSEIRVEGHTDSVPIGKRASYHSNWELSMARAYSVIRALEEMGVKSERLSGVGYGEYRPIADNKTAEGRAKNRRISVSLMRVK